MKTGKAIKDLDYEYLKWEKHEVAQELVRKKEETDIIHFIMDLLNELDIGDDVPTTQVYEYIKKDYTRVSHDYIRRGLISICEKEEGYKFVRLKDVVRKEDQITLQLDNLIRNFESMEEKHHGKTNE